MIPLNLTGPLTANAQRFTSLYGSAFRVMGMATPATLQLQSLMTGRKVHVERRPEGIFVDYELFCKDWVDTK